MKRDTRFLRDKNLLVIGLGETGTAVINKIHPFCNSITGIDSNPSLAVADKLKLEKDNVEVILKEDIVKNEKLLSGKSLVIISPGVPGQIPLVKYAMEDGIPIWSEVELSWKLMNSWERENTIAVTGTNGKTTVVTLVGEILKNSGIRVEVCGNIGNPLISTLNIGSREEDFRNEKDLQNKVRVIEVSSFQLERVYSFKPHVGVILNITEDHLDRHESMENYIDLKFKLLKNQDEGDYAILNFDDLNIAKKIADPSFSQNLSSDLITYSLILKRKVNIWYEKDNIFYYMKGKRGKINLENIIMQGRHNISNALACVAIAKLWDVDDESLENSIKNFKPLEHRLEYLGEVNGIRCFNDSKSTNPDATINALYNFRKEVTLILGGQDKNMDFRELIPFLNQKVKHLILIGECAPKIYKILTQSTHDYQIYKCSTLEEAVDVGFRVTRKGEVFLLSPSCASMDMFRNYKERGERFKKLVMAKKLATGD